jgi:hypothetical protein
VQLNAAGGAMQQYGYHNAWVECSLQIAGHLANHPRRKKLAHASFSHLSAFWRNHSSYLVEPLGSTLKPWQIQVIQAIRSCWSATAAKHEVQSDSDPITKAGYEHYKLRFERLVLAQVTQEHDKNGALIMGKIDICNASDAVSSMQTLRLALTEDLDDIENRIHELAQSGLASSNSVIGEIKVYYVARAALYSALASINEVLGWVHLMAEKDSEGNVAEVVRSLPTVPVFSVH